MPVGFPTGGDYDRAVDAVNRVRKAGPERLGRRRKSSPLGIRPFLGRAAADIAVGTTGGVDLVDSDLEETGRSLDAANLHTQFGIEAGSLVSGYRVAGINLIVWVDRCPDEVGPPPERCYCDPVYGYEGTAYGGLV
ncbi:hypothetical protein, partial [Alienimonas sp. DA493]|uniref:hypothetical protein n=1 Tax=Alienimonas sp. DA493 TaxID=3373605 RepID=UPI0037550757